MLSIIIPCYNEEKNLPIMIERLDKMVGNRQDIEIILVNNGSTDESASVLSEIIASKKSVVINTVSVPINQGYGHGILAGLAASKGEVLAWTHADMQTDPCDVIKAYDLYLQQRSPCLIKGKRYQRGLLDTVFTYGMQCIANFLLKAKLDDINAQPKLFSRVFYAAYLKERAPWDFSLDLFLLYQAQKNQVPVLSVPVVFSKRMHGEAKGGGGGLKQKYKLSKRTLKYIWALKKNLPSVFVKGVT